MCIHVYYAGSGSTRHVEHPESAETEPLSPKSNRSGISLAFWALRFPSLAALFVLCSIEGQPQPLPSARTGHQPSLYPCPCSLLTHSLSCAPSKRSLSDSGTLPVPHRRTRASLGSPSRSSHWFRVHSSIRCGSIPIASLTANRALLAPRSTGSSASLPELRLLRRSPPANRAGIARDSFANTFGTSLSAAAPSWSLTPTRLAAPAPPRRCAQHLLSLPLS